MRRFPWWLVGCSWAWLPACAERDTDVTTSRPGHDQLDAATPLGAQPANDAQDAGAAGEVDAGTAEAASAEPYPYSEPSDVESGSLVYWSQFGTGELQLRSPGEEPLVLSPARGRDWGFQVEAGDRRLYNPVASPDGRWAVACLGDHAFALATDGSTRDEPLLLADVCGDIFFSSDGKELGIRAQYFQVPDELWVMPFDPPDPAGLTRVAAFDGESTVRVRGATGAWWVFHTDDEALNAVTLDGRTTELPGYRFRFLLPDARLVVTDDDEGALHLFELETGALTLIAPPLESSWLVGTIDAGARAVFRAKFGDEYQLFSAALDGTDAAQPRMLGQPLGVISSVILLPETRRAIGRVDKDVVDVSLDSERPMRVFAQSEYVSPLAASQDERWLYGCSEEETIMRLDTEDPTAIWTPYELSNERLAEGGGQTWLNAERFWTCGEYVLPTPGTTGSSEHVAQGRLEVVSSTKSAVYLRSPDGDTRRISAYHSRALGQMVLVPAVGRLYYRVPSDTRWWTVRLDGSERAQAVPVLTPDGREMTGSGQLVGDHIVFSYTPGEHLPPELWVANGAVTQLLVEQHDQADDPALQEFEGELLISDWDNARRVPLDGGPPTVLLDRRPTTVAFPASTDDLKDFVIDPIGRQVIVHSENQLLAAALDGSEASDPRVLVAQLPEEIYAPAAIVGDDALFLTAFITAGNSFGDMLWRAALDGSDREAAQPVETVPTGLLNRGGPFVSRDGSWVLTGHNELALARLPLSEGTVVELTGPGQWTDVVAVPPQADYVIVESAYALWRVPLTPEAGTELSRLTPDNDLGGFDNVSWLPEREELLFTWRQYSQSGIARAAVDGSDAEAFRTILGRDLQAYLRELADAADPDSLLRHDSLALDSLSPDGEWFVYNLSPPGSLMGAYHDDEPFSLTGETDVVEHFIGWVP